ncbi:MAG: rRNA maturation RNase YbeY [Acidimicrobiia bacterium]
MNGDRPGGPPARTGPDGDVEVYLSDEQDDVDIDIVRWERLARAALVAEGVKGEAELNVLFVDEAHIADLNEEFLGASGPTDVLAFPLDADLVDIADAHRRTGPDRAPLDPSDYPLLLGDIVVCPKVAARNAPTHAGDLDDELALLIVHGILHVLGHDHAEPEETVRMRARELELLEQFHWNAPAPARFRQEHDEP